MFGGNAVVGADPPVVVVDTWDGYDGERRVVLDAVGATADNLVVLTGDFHSAVVADLRVDPFDPSLPVVGTEFMASSISSSFFDDDETVESLVSRRARREPTDQVVRLPARLHGLRGHARPLARHLPRRGRSVRRDVPRRRRQHVGDRRRDAGPDAHVVGEPDPTPAIWATNTTLYSVGYVAHAGLEHCRARGGIRWHGSFKGSTSRTARAT